MRLGVVSEGDAQGYRLKEGGHALAIMQRAILERPVESRQQIVPVVGYGNPVQVLLDHAQGINADFMIIGKHSPEGITDYLLGSVARHVVADAGCDVLVIALEQEPLQPEPSPARATG
jgi:nucleotide-binding universal stress UspA family protein